MSPWQSCGGMQLQSSLNRLGAAVCVCVCVKGSAHPSRMSFWWSALTPLSLTNQMLNVRHRTNQEPPTATVLIHVVKSFQHTNDTAHLRELTNA